MLKSIRKIAITRKMPTPSATARINTRFGIEGTCCASTCKSGSEIVITNPIIKVINTTLKMFFDLVIIVPTRSPIGVMEISTPTLKNNIPTIKRMAPIRNVIKILGGIGAIEKQRSKTITSIGTTAFRVSISFSLIIFQGYLHFLFMNSLCIYCIRTSLANLLNSVILLSKVL